ncbi:MAG: InlB B-repeat-containing protein, partial [Firmicutes bacterium]|nr:InlB B-repeat-containing protein [Bacillota bacterium]
MFRKILSKLAALSITTKIIIGIVTVAIVFGLIMFGATQPMDAPDKQDLQQDQQADIMDADDVEKDGIFKEFFSNIFDILTGNDPTDKAEEVRYIVKFETNGGGEIKDQSVVAGTNISKLPTPNRNGYIFLGWYYDKGLEKAVESDDEVDKNMTLYASYLEQTPLDTLERVNFAAAENVGKDFTIKVISSDSTMSAKDVEGSLTALNLTNPNAKDFIKVTDVDDGFVISGIKESGDMGIIEGFEEGATYTIKLNSDALSFDGYPETAREFNFTTYKEEVLNFKLNDDITFIPASDLKNITNNGQNVSTLDIALYTVRNDGSMSAADLTEGTFEYTKGALKVGEIVSVYDGLIPTERTLDTPADQLGDIGYVEITAKDGNKYSYKSAQAEDIIFTPDMLPVPEGVDLDKKASTITVDDKYFDYSKDFYASMDLGSQTTVDVGDFLVFYTGNLEITQGKNAAERKGFAEVTGVTKNDNGTTTVKYKEVSWDYVDSSMDVYTQDEMTADELLEGINKEEVEAEIEQQAIDSGFVEEAAQYLASLSLATDNFSKLSDNMNLEDYKVVLKDGTPVTPEQLNLMSGGISAQVADTKVKATVSRKPSHLGNVSGTDADKEGIAISLEVTSVITIDSADDEGELEITVTGKFVEEIGFDYGASSDTEWDWAVIIPYIKEWTVSANIDLLNYTGLEITATMITKEADDDSIFGEAANIAEEIKALLEKNTNPETGDDYHTKLIEKYSEMVHADSDWIRIVEINIFEFDKHLPPALPIIHLEVTVDFVIQMDASVAVGFEFEYLEGERYVFNVRITEGDITSNSVSLKEKTYELNFYTMGRMAIKAGVELEFKVGLFSTKLANIGFDAGAGPYTKLYGYFYYELKYTESMGRSQNYSGALLTQVGVYFHLGLNAEAIGGKYSSSVDLVDEEWLLWQAGRRDNVLDFATAQNDLPEMVMRQYVRRVQLPDNVFNMLYLDLITGDDKNAIYNDWNDPDRENDFRNGENYSIKMTNDKFSYDPKTNEIVVRADEEDIKIEGEMIITWKQKAMSFSSKPLQRRVKLYWDNLRDGYMIVPYTNGGSYVPLIAKGYEEKVTKPADPTKLGYIFDGWYTDEEFTKPYTFPKAMPNKDTNIYAKWEAATDIPYTVEHYLENFKSGEYELVETETFEGTTDTYVSPAVNYYEGYASPEVQEVKVEADGSSVLRYYYKLHRSSVTFESGLDGKEDSTFTLKYGARISAPKMSAKGYEFKGWTIDGTTVVI